MASSYFPSQIANKAKLDDSNSVIYASTDDGWTHNEASDEETEDVSPDYSRSESPDLIDFSDSGDATIHNTIDLTPGLAALPQAQSNLNPESPPFMSSKSSFTQSPPATSSTSSYTDARQSLDPRDDRIISLQARIKDLENEHETLKRANDDLDTVNDIMKHELEGSKSCVEKLRSQVSEAELLRTRAQKTAIELSEKNEKLHVTVAQLQEELEEVEPQVSEYKKKLAGALNSNRPLHGYLHDMQARLLHAVQHIKEIEFFARGFLAEHPEYTEIFATVRLFPQGAGQQYDSSGQIEADALISFDEPQTDLLTSLLPEQEHPSSCIANTEYQASPFQKTPIVSIANLDDNQLLLQNAITQPQTVEAQSPTIITNSTASDLHGLKWSPECDKIWVSEFQRVQAIRNHQGPRPAAHVPGMFIHGIRFVREHGTQKLMTDDGIPDVASRRVIMSSLPDNVHLQRVLEHVRGGRVLKAHIVTVGNIESRRRMAYIEFTTAEKAMEFYRFTRRREFGFFDGERSVRAHMELPATDSFPLSEMQQAQLSEGHTRCLSVTDFPVVHLQAVLNFAGMTRNFTDVITHFTHSDDGSFEISFADIRSAVVVRDCILRSKFYGGGRDGAGVTFLPDPCEAPLDSLQVPFLPAESTSDLSILDPENARLFMTEEERQLDGDRLMEEVVAAADPGDPDAFQEQDLRKNIVWEKEANWEEVPVYLAYDPDQRREVPHQRDPASGSVRIQYHGSWVLSPEEARKMWLHYNQGSPHPWTQKTADLFYAATGDIDLRKIVVDDGGIHGDSDQAITEDELAPRAPNEPAWLNGSVSAAPFLSDVAREYVTFDDASKHVPVGVYMNNIGSNSGMGIPSLLDQDILTNMAASVSSTPVPPRLRGRKHNPGSPFASSSPSITSDDNDGTVHGISKPIFNRLAARIAKDRNHASGKTSNVQPPFW